MAFDTLTYARQLKAAGVPEAQAEAIADATRELVVVNFATREDLAAVEQRLLAAIDTLSLRLTMRVGIMLAAGLSILGAVLRLHS